MGNTLLLFEQPVDLPAFAFRRPPRALRPGQKLLHGLHAGFGKLFRRRLIVAKIRDQLRPNATQRNGAHHQRARDQVLLHADGLTCADIAGGLGRLRTDLNAPGTASLGGQAARFKNAHGPQPFIEPAAQQFISTHFKNLRS